MKTISWNCRGLGSPRAVRSLARLLKVENPHLVFLMETRLKKEEMLKLKRKFKFNSDVSVDCSGAGRDRAGGLCLWWNDDLDINITSYSQNHIAGKCLNEDEDDAWFFAGIYGYPDEARKMETWNLIHALKEEGGSKTIFFGDLNDTISEADKVGGINRTVSQLQRGRNTMATCGLQEVSFEGYPFTWTNGRVGSENIQCRLDKSLTSFEFMQSFPLTRVFHLERYGSDHAALRIVIQREEETGKQRHLFRFEEAWTKEGRCGDLIKLLCRRNSGPLPKRLRSMQELNYEFKDLRTNNIRKEILRLEELIKADKRWSGDPVEIQEYKAIEIQRDRLLKVEETLWR
ncbi:uncharacterized protein LOC131658114 [Vicia villosa]|uniref:uncharacterized protein LOC131658114 n=1 Tax=Vicia villosa TaxID=3911 RepID=UPI00273BCD9B|nr:uncharacterized protein LOC131658114 [Vicia villosa]